MDKHIVTSTIRSDEAKTPLGEKLLYSARRHRILSPNSVSGIQYPACSDLRSNAQDPPARQRKVEEFLAVILLLEKERNWWKLSRSRVHLSVRTHDKSALHA
ncbi:MAG: hypothetical protein ABSC00_05890 [Acidimicrobiales bacterium]